MRADTLLEKTRRPWAAVIGSMGAALARSNMQSPQPEPSPGPRTPGGWLHYLTGPVRSGKSAEGVRIASTWGAGAVFVATYRPDPADAEMMDRIHRHQVERPGWRTLEAVPDVAEALSRLDPPPSGVLLDCLTLWTSDRFHLSDEVILANWDEQLTHFKTFPWPMVIVGNEIGWAPVPADPSLRRFRDLVGFLGQRTAAAADEASLLVAGCRVKLKYDISIL